jgi:cell division protein FtsL
MTPPASTAAARRAARAPARRPATRVAPRIPRRVSGPLRPRPAAQPLGVRLAAFASTLPDRGIVDRLVRGRAWIAVVGTLLIGIVAMQVSLLRLNAAIGSDVERATALERTNGELRAQVSQLESGERIQDLAAQLGMVMPPAGQITYLQAGGAATAGAAAEALRQQSFNDPAKAQPLPVTTGDQGTGQ